MALDGTYYAGGVTTIEGEEASGRLSNSRFGVTLALPVNGRNSVKLFGHTGASVRTGSDFDALGAVWQYRWGGGIP